MSTHLLPHPQSRRQTHETPLVEGERPPIVIRNPEERQLTREESEKPLTPEESRKPALTVSKTTLPLAGKAESPQLSPQLARRPSTPDLRQLWTKRQPSPSKAQMLTDLAQPQTFSGPEREIQQELGTRLEEIGDRQFPALSVFGIGGVLLPEVLPDDPEELIRNCRLIDPPNPSVASKLSFLDHGDDGQKLKDSIIRNTVATMLRAGQIDYLKGTDLTHGQSRILVEVHYYRDRDQSQLGFHKDTKGQTLFVNLNFQNDREIAGPEYIVNPPPVAAHDQRTQATLPQTFRTHMAEAQKKLPAPVEIGASRIPPFGVVAFTDELIHHATPLYGHRKITGADLDAYLKETSPNDYWWASTALGKAYTWVTSFFWKTDAATVRFRNLVDIAKNSDVQYDRTQLSAMGLTKAQIDELLTKSDPARGTTQKPQRFPFERVDIPNAGQSPIRPGQPPLERRMSTDYSKGDLPGQVAGKRKFFRTWVRSIPATDLEKKTAGSTPLQKATQ
jgi:hypothetical protein